VVLLRECDLVAEHRVIPDTFADTELSFVLALVYDVELMTFVVADPFLLLGVVAAGIGLVFLLDYCARDWVVVNARCQR
jgi:hypothetical protein